MSRHVAASRKSVLETLKVQKKLDNPKTPVYTFEVGSGGLRMIL